jgi:hypothetical protein
VASEKNETWTYRGNLQECTRKLRVRNDKIAVNVFDNEPPVSRHGRERRRALIRKSWPSIALGLHHVRDAPALIDILDNRRANLGDQGDGVEFAKHGHQSQSGSELHKSVLHWSLSFLEVNPDWSLSIRRRMRDQPLSPGS